MATKKTYLYRGSGFAVGGSITKPVNKPIPIQAATALPTVGGYGTVRAEKFDFENILSFKSAFCQVAGNENDNEDSFNTLVTATVEGLEVGDMVTADRIIARLSSVHHDGSEEPEIIFLGSQFENLRIAGTKVNVELDQELYVECPTHEKFMGKLSKDKTFKSKVLNQFCGGETGTAKAPSCLQERRAAMSALKGDCRKERVIGTLVKGLTVANGTCQTNGHTIYVPQFGYIHLAEVVLSHGTRRLNMLTFELGSPIKGRAVVASSDGNGTWGG